jgi:hypothetical protein
MSKISSTAMRVLSIAAPIAFLVIETAGKKFP